MSESPFPKLYTAIKGDAVFLEAARPYAVLLLTLTNTVASIHRLDLRMQAKKKLAVKFEGQRPQRYVHQDPYIIKIIGTCDLTGDS